MFKVGNKAKYILVITLFFYFIICNTSISQSISEIKDKIQQTTDNKTILEKEIASYESQLKDISSQADSLGNAVKILDTTIKKNSVDIKLTQNNINETELEIDKLSLNIDRSVDVIDQNRKVIAEMINETSKTDESTFIENILIYKDTSEFWNEVESVYKIQNKIREKVNETKVVKKGLEIDKEDAIKKRKKLLSYKAELDDKKQILDMNKKEKNQLLLNTKNQESNYKNILGGVINENENNNNNILNVNNVIFDNKNIVFELIKKMDFIIKQNEEFKKQNEEFKEDINKLKEDNENLKSKIILSTEINKNDIKNFINVNIQINNFNDVDYLKMNPKNIIKTLIKEQGKQIILKTIQDIFVNPEKPENHNIYIADKNRKYLKTYNNEKWNSENFKIIDNLIEKIVNVYKLSIEEIKKDIKLYDKIKQNIQNKMKYLNYCDLEYLAELEYEQENDEIDNKDEIKRSKEFYEMVQNDIINLLYDNKNIILNTHKNNILST